MKKHKAVFLTILLLLIVFLLLNIILSNKCLSVSEYKLSSDKMSETIRIVQLTDLHNSSFGENNKRLINIINKQNCDAVFITGDVLNSYEDDFSVAQDLIKKLAKKYPVYISLGNHEIEYGERTGISIKQLFSNVGATVLDEEFVDTEIKGNKLRIGGVYGYCLPERYLERHASNRKQYDFLCEFEEADCYKILLSHLPYGWWNYGFGKDWDVDLVLCGHTHGGQLVIPLLGGLYDAETGWFPGKVSGYKYDGADIIVSRGIGNTSKIPRINNMPEILTVQIDGSK